MKLKSYLKEAVDYKQKAEELLDKYGKEEAYDFILNQMVMNREGDGWVEWHKIGIELDKLAK